MTTKLKLKSIFYILLSMLALFIFNSPWVHASENSNSTSQSEAKVLYEKKIPNQNYSLYLTGQNPIYDHPGIITGSKITYDEGDVQQLINQNAKFMAYRVAKINNGYTYYKVVSLHHNIRGWIRDTGISKKNVSNADSNNGAKNKVTFWKSIPKQKYNKILSGDYQIFTKPATIAGAKLSYDSKAVRQLINQDAKFMVYQVAKTSDGETFYKIVSLHNFVRGWIHANGIKNSNNTNFSYD